MSRRKSVASDYVSLWSEEQVPAPGLRWRKAVFTKEVSEASKSNTVQLMQG